MNKKEQIIAEYQKTYIAHPSYRDIAQKLGCSKSLVAKYVKEHIASLGADSKA